MNSLKALISEGEHQRQDFKFRIDDQKKIARTLVAFANTDGGRLLIGVKDNGKVTGINPEEEFHMIEGAASLFSKPEVQFETKVWQDDFRLVLEVNVAANPLKNHLALDEDGKWKTYIRRGDHTLLANKILLAVWKLNRKEVARPQVLSDDALEILKLVEMNPGINISQLYRKSSLKKSLVDHFLSLFVYWGNVAMDISEEGVFYSLVEG